MNNLQQADADQSDRAKRMELTQIIDFNHPIVQLANAIPWSQIENMLRSSVDSSLSPFSIRLMIGLQYLQETNNISDAEVLSVWEHNPYWQYFCGYRHFERSAPVDAQALKRWREQTKDAWREWQRLLKDAQCLDGRVTPEATSLLGLERAFNFLLQSSI